MSRTYGSRLESNVEFEKMYYIADMMPLNGRISLEIDERLFPLCELMITQNIADNERNHKISKDYVVNKVKKCEVVVVPNLVKLGGVYISSS